MPRYDPKEVKEVAEIELSLKQPGLPYPEHIQDWVLSTFKDRPYDRRRAPAVKPYHQALISLLEYFWPRPLFTVNAGFGNQIPVEQELGDGESYVIYVTTVIKLLDEKGPKPYALPVFILEVREPGLFDRDEDRHDTGLMLRQRLNRYFDVWPGSSDVTPAGTPLSAIPGIYAGVAYGLHHLAPFFLNNQTQTVQPSLYSGSPPNTNPDPRNAQSNPTNPSLNSREFEGDTLPQHQFGHSLLDPQGFKMMAAIAERTVQWLRESDLGDMWLLGEYKTPNPGGLADDGLPFGSSAHLPQFQRPQFRRPLGDSDPGAARKDPKEWVEDMGEDRSAYQKYIPASAERRTSLVAGQGEHDEEVDEPESEVLELEEDERVRCEILSL